MTRNPCSCLTTERLRWYDLLLWVLPALVLVFTLYDLNKFVSTDGEGYPIGWEGGGWTYQTAGNFIIHHLIHVGRIAAAFAFYWLPPRPILRPAGRLLCTWDWLDLLCIEISSALEDLGVVLPFN